MNEVESTEAIQTEATPDVTVESTPEAVTSEPVVEEVQAESTQQAESTSEPEAPKTGTERFSTLMKTLGDVPDTPNEQLLSTIDEKSIENLPSSAKGLLKHLIAQQKVEHQKELEAVKAQNQQLTEREQRIKTESKRLIQNRAELNRVLLDPKFQQFLKQADMPEDKMADAFTKEGIQQRIQKGVAEAMQEFQKPITEAAEKARQMAAYTNFVDANPKMNEKAFKKDVLALMQTREQESQPIGIQDAYKMVEFDRMKKAEDQRKQKEMKARAKSNRMIGRTTVSSSAEVGDPVPTWVTKKGYNGARGHAARAMYLRDNPKALAKLRAQQKSR